jgi:NAD(P)-dependent dehydrogenase (short-subunit alcohol dehydrogenase family)
MDLFIVTGSSRGMGLGIARQLLAPDHLVLGIARQTSPALTDASTSNGGALIQWQQDLADPLAAAARLQAWLAAQDGTQFASASLINNAALLTPPGALETSSDASLSACLRVGLEAPTLLAAAFLRATAGWPGARKVLNISSGLGRRAMAGSASYCAIKAGLDHLSRAMALDQALVPNGAKVVSLAPGVIDTDMQVQLRSSDPAQFSSQAMFQAMHDNGQLDSIDSAGAKVIAFLHRADFGNNPVADVRDA